MHYILKWLLPIPLKVRSPKYYAMAARKQFKAVLVMGANRWDAIKHRSAIVVFFYNQFCLCSQIMYYQSCCSCMCEVILVRSVCYVFHYSGDNIL